MHLRDRIGDNFGTIAAGWLAVIVVSATTTTSAQQSSPPLTLTRVASGLSRTVYATAAPGDPSKLFVVEQGGRIKIVENGSVLATPFLDISSMVSSGNEQGLLGLTFDPNYQTNRKFYVDYTDLNGNTNIASYQVSASNSRVANTTQTPILSIAQPYANHNGGWLGFGPDNNLYIAMGDGGDSNDPGNRAQSLDSLLGKMLRINPNGADAFPADATRNYAIPASNPFVNKSGADEIWAYGLRNPWRNSFDSATGDLYIGDVGQGAREEIDYQAASSTGGENYGWRAWEGTQSTGLGGLNNTSPALFPIHEYGHTSGNIAVTGGYVYRGDAIEGLDGTYFFGDYGSGRVWSFRYDGTTKTEFQQRNGELVPNVGTLNRISSFGEGADGELYIVDLDGEIFKIGSRIFGDANNDRLVDGADYTVWADNFLKTGTSFDQGDFNRDGIVNGVDYVLWAGHFSPRLSASVVPEPSSLALFAAGLAGLAVAMLRAKSRG